MNLSPQYGSGVVREQDNQAYNKVVEIANSWKNVCEKLQEEKLKKDNDIPIQEHNRVIEVANGWKNTCYKLKDFRSEDAQYFMQHITYLENLLNTNNINFENYERY